MTSLYLNLRMYECMFLWNFKMLTHQTHCLLSSVLFISENVNIHKKIKNKECLHC